MVHGIADGEFRGGFGEEAGYLRGGVVEDGTWNMYMRVVCDVGLCPLSMSM